MSKWRPRQWSVKDILGVSRQIDILQRRNDDLSDRDDVEFRRNGGYEFGSYARGNRCPS
jgi:hypothetical protein